MLKIEEITFYYSDSKKCLKRKIIDNVSFGIKEDSFVSIIGPSGCGKTTLANLIVGYLKPQNGKIIEKGKVVQGPGHNRFLINQEDDLFEWMTLKENIEFVTKKNVDKYLSLVHLNGSEQKYPHELSGGMKKRASIARALAANAEYLIIDEAFSSLDYQIKEKLYMELTQIWKKTKKTIIFITHDIEEAILLSDRIIVLTKLPAKIKKEIKVPFTRPRKREFKYSKKFINLEKKIQKMID